MRVSYLFGSLWLCSVGLAQSSGLQLDISPRIVGHTLSDGQVTVVQVAPRFATAIRMHEPVNSVVLGDPSAFSAEHSEREPNIVFVKPITLKAASTNVVITTSGGHQANVLLVSRGQEKSAERAGVDLLLRYKPAGRFLIEQSELPAATIGDSLSHEALRRYGGAEEVERIRDIAKLTMVMERMEDVARGVARLKRAVETVGIEPYNLLRTEMNLPSDSIADIPTREMLKRLVERMEALAKRPAAECAQS